MKMQEKASLAAYLSSGFLVFVGKVGIPTNRHPSDLGASRARR